MPLFLIGADLSATMLLLLALIIFGVLIFHLARRVFRKTLKQASERRINVLSRICAVVLAPLLLIGILASMIYASMPPRESEEEMLRRHYKMVEEDIANDLKIGMSKLDVVKFFGETDTTQSVMIYDFTLPSAKEKYILELTFDQGHLKSFRRRQ